MRTTYLGQLRPQLCHDPLDEEVPELYPLETFLRRGYGVEYSAPSLESSNIFRAEWTGGQNVMCHQAECTVKGSS